MDPSQFLKWDLRTSTLVAAGFCTMLSVHFTSQLLSQHLFYWKNPKEQKAIVVIILMAPVYAVNSFFGLVKITGSETLFTFLDAIKECYEAIVIAAFLYLMYSYMGISVSKNIIPDEIKGRVIHNSFPLTLFVPHEAPLNQKNLKLIQWWTWQFIILRPLLSAVMILLQKLEVYEGAITWVISITLNLSVSLAMYSLVLFYHLFHKELAPHNPLAKFICIKGVVFFSFWQGVVLQLLASAGALRREHMWLEVNQIEEAYQNLLVCVEMAVFAVFQQYAFSVAEYSKDFETRMAAQIAKADDRKKVD
eukprot:TRINITY_DN1704_c0_g2_i1.p1 TRINITY_DN1704_c0_g2~~TRINITY_DN1704_c0_g2_i1.p1  ORF type:complete len:306 (+),score=54.91 TRINITY_DN1704_c0_g2_i1:192-1109(+)